jgi:hypothetical protein
MRGPGYANFVPVVVQYRARLQTDSSIFQKSFMDVLVRDTVAENGHWSSPQSPFRQCLRVQARNDGTKRRLVNMQEGI